LVPSSTQKRRWNFFFFSVVLCIIFSRISKNVKPIGKRKYPKILPSEPDSYSLSPPPGPQRNQVECWTNVTAAQQHQIFWGFFVS
jgi:hypothetical protein